MLEQSVALFKSFFVYSGLSWNYILVGILLGIVFGAIWLSAHWPPLFEKRWLWAVAPGSALLTLLAFAFIQIARRMGIKINKKTVFRRPSWTFLRGGLLQML